MPATEQTWRDQPLMHMIFGISGLVMLLSTLWMLYADYNRGWKPVQRQSQEIDNWFTEARIVERSTGDYLKLRAELEADLKKIREQAPDAQAVQSFVADLPGSAAESEAARIERALEAAGSNPSAKTREAVMSALDSALKKVRFRENDLARDRKFERANLDVARSNFDLGVGNNLSASKLAELEEDVRLVEKKVNDLTESYEAAKTVRLSLEAKYAAIVQPESDAQKALADHDADLEKLKKAYAARTRPTRNVLTLPILDAFNSPLKIEQLWLPQLTINYNFKDVARFDRCTTCHQGIGKTAAGSAVLPGFEPVTRLTLSLPTPATPPAEAAATEGQPVSTSVAQRKLLEEVYGLALSDQGLLSEKDVTVQVVWPLKPGAQAGLKAGDIIEFVGGTKVTGPDIVARTLVESVTWGQPISLRVRRGLPHPFSSHPRLDLFVGSLSPHTSEKFGCTICHEGQGSATEFKWASHTPNTLIQMEDWQTDHQWFHNHHWIFPMHPQRFLESSCLKCHHEVVELEQSERYPEPPAPKLLAGYNAIRQYGCFGCHEINGFNGPTKRVGPDLRTEPSYTAAAQQLLADPALPAEARGWAEAIIEDQDRVEPRHLLFQLLDADARRAAAKDSGEPPLLSADSRRMQSVLADVDTPGKLRKPGPSLRYVGSKVDASFLTDWIGDPTNFRPSTRMPRFFGLFDHLRESPELTADEALVAEHGPGEQTGLQKSEKFEPVEIRATVEYLLAMSQKFDYVDAPEGVTETPSAERGKFQFQTRGCLACHQHKDFPEAKATQGPDLSRIGAKLTKAPAESKLYNWSEKGARWLYSWVRKPNRYHTRTVMPDVQLTTITKENETSDPAADVTAYLLSSQEWQPKEAAPLHEDVLQELAVTHLKDKVTARQAAEYARSGIPAEQAGDFKGDESLLVGEMTDDNRAGKLLLYVGKRTISKYGCAGCHDIPGYEDAKPIGTGLNNWARKDLAQLAFEQVTAYATRNVHGAGHDDHGSHGHGPDLRGMDPSTGYFLHHLLNHQREGFLWQKLREPRSYDYMKTENKGYNERLRMPKFNFNAQQVDEVMTFVLGLVAEPPAAQYVYNPGPQQKAIVEGRKVLDKFNCAGCHELQTEQWEFEFNPAHPDFANERTFPENEYEFFRPHFTPKELEASRQTDRRGMGHATITARQFMGEDGKPQEQEDSEDPEKMVNYYVLWKPAAINGQVYLANDQATVRNDWITGHHAALGGDFARLLHPVALANERLAVPQTKFDNAWGFVPPPLVHEGRKVQPGWLHNFLMDPHPIRPAVVLRMPHFHMSSADASKLVDYFAAADGAEFPYEFDRRTRESYLKTADAEEPGRLEDAARIVTNGTYCIKCHLVGDYSPQGSNAAKAPDLAKIHARLRPEFTLHWVGNPTRLLPYTGMPVNFAPDKPVDLKAFKGEGGELIQHGKAPQQLEAVVDFLMNYDYFMKQRNQLSITAPPPVQPGEAPPAEEGAGDQGAEGAAKPEDSSETLSDAGS